MAQRLKLNSPVGAEPLILKWPVATSEGKEGPEEIVDTIRLVCEDFPELTIPFETRILKDGDKVAEYDFDETKNLCDRYNKAIDSVRQLVEGSPRQKEFNERASMKQLKHVLQQCYNRSVKDPDKLNHYEPFSPEVYGETSFELVEQMIKSVKFSETDSFIDLGSGVGQVVLQVSAATDCKFCYGIEKADWPAQYAVGMEREFRRWMKWYGKKHGNFLIEKGDFLQDNIKEKLNQATVVFVNNFAFGPMVDHELKQRFANHLKEGARIVSSKAFCPLNFRITARNLSDIGTMMSVQELSPLCGAVSWTGKPFAYYVHTIDRTLLEKYFQRMKNPNFKDEDEPRRDRRGRPLMSIRERVNGALHLNTTNGGRRKGNRDSDNGKAVKVLDFDERSNASSTNTEDSNSAHYGPTTRRQWNEYVKRPHSQSGTESENNSSNVESESKGPGKRGRRKKMKTTKFLNKGALGQKKMKDEPESPPNQSLEQERPKRITKLRPRDKLMKPHDSPESVRMAGVGQQATGVSASSTVHHHHQQLHSRTANQHSSNTPSLDSLNLLHAHTIMSTSGQDSSEKVNYNDKRMAAPSNAYFKPSIQQQTVSSLEKEAGFLCMIESMKQRFLSFLSFMQTPEYRAMLALQIEQEKVKHAKLVGQQENLEKQISTLQKDGVYLIKERLKELGIKADNPADLISQAKKVVMKQKELQAQTSSLHHHIRMLQAEQNNKLTSAFNKIMDLKNSLKTGKIGTLESNLTEEQQKLLAGVSHLQTELRHLQRVNSSYTSNSNCISNQSNELPKEREESSVDQSKACNSKISREKIEIKENYDSLDEVLDMLKKEMVAASHAVGQASRDSKDGQHPPFAGIPTISSLRMKGESDDVRNQRDVSGKSREMTMKEVLERTNPSRQQQQSSSSPSLSSSSSSSFSTTAAFTASINQPQASSFSSWKLGSSSEQFVTHSSPRILPPGMKIDLKRPSKMNGLKSNSKLTPPPNKIPREAEGGETVNGMNSNLLPHCYTDFEKSAAEDLISLKDGFNNANLSKGKTSRPVSEKNRKDKISLLKKSLISKHSTDIKRSGSGTISNEGSSITTTIATAGSSTSTFSYLQSAMMQTSHASAVQHQTGNSSHSSHTNHLQFMSPATDSSSAKPATSNAKASNSAHQSLRIFPKDPRGDGNIHSTLSTISSVVSSLNHPPIISSTGGKGFLSLSGNVPASSSTTHSTNTPGALQAALASMPASNGVQQPLLKFITNTNKPQFILTPKIGSNGSITPASNGSRIIGPSSGVKFLTTAQEASSTAPPMSRKLQTSTDNKACTSPRSLLSPHFDAIVANDSCGGLSNSTALKGENNSCGQSESEPENCMRGSLNNGTGCNSSSNVTMEGGFVTTLTNRTVHKSTCNSAPSGPSDECIDEVSLNSEGGINSESTTKTRPCSVLTSGELSSVKEGLMLLTTKSKDDAHTSKETTVDTEADEGVKKSAPNKASSTKDGDKVSNKGRSSEAPLKRSKTVKKQEAQKRLDKDGGHVKQTDRNDKIDKESLRTKEKVRKKMDKIEEVSKRGGKSSGGSQETCKLTKSASSEKSSSSLDRNKGREASVSKDNPNEKKRKDDISLNLKGEGNKNSPKSQGRQEKSSKDKSDVVYKDKTNLSKISDKRKKGKDFISESVQIKKREDTDDKSNPPRLKKCEIPSDEGKEGGNKPAPHTPRASRKSHSSSPSTRSKRSDGEKEEEEGKKGRVKVSKQSCNKWPEPPKLEPNAPLQDDSGISKLCTSLSESFVSDEKTSSSERMSAYAKNRIKKKAGEECSKGSSSTSGSNSKRDEDDVKEKEKSSKSSHRSVEKSELEKGEVSKAKKKHMKSKGMSSDGKRDKSLERKREKDQKQEEIESCKGSNAHVKEKSEEDVSKHKKNEGKDEFHGKKRSRNTENCQTHGKRKNQISNASEVTKVMKKSPDSEDNFEEQDSGFYSEGSCMSSASMKVQLSERDNTETTVMNELDSEFKESLCKSAQSTEAISHCTSSTSSPLEASVEREEIPAADQSKAVEPEKQFSHDYQEPLFPDSTKGITMKKNPKHLKALDISSAQEVNDKAYIHQGPATPPGSPTLCLRKRTISRSSSSSSSSSSNSSASSSSASDRGAGPLNRDTPPCKTPPPKLSKLDRPLTLNVGSMPKLGSVPFSPVSNPTASQGGYLRLSPATYSCPDLGSSNCPGMAPVSVSIQKTPGYQLVITDSMRSPTGVVTSPPSGPLAKPYLSRCPATSPPSSSLDPHSLPIRKRDHNTMASKTNENLAASPPNLRYGRTPQNLENNRIKGKDLSKMDAYSRNDFHLDHNANNTALPHSSQFTVTNDNLRDQSKAVPKSMFACDEKITLPQSPVQSPPKSISLQTSKSPLRQEGRIDQSPSYSRQKSGGPCLQDGLPDQALPLAVAEDSGSHLAGNARKAASTTHRKATKQTTKSHHSVCVPSSSPQPDHSRSRYRQPPPHMATHHHHHLKPASSQHSTPQHFYPSQQPRTGPPQPPVGYHDNRQSFNPHYAPPPLPSSSHHLWTGHKGEAPPSSSRHAKSRSPSFSSPPPAPFHQNFYEVRPRGYPARGPPPPSDSDVKWILVMPNQAASSSAPSNVTIMNSSCIGSSTTNSAVHFTDAQGFV